MTKALSIRHVLTVNDLKPARYYDETSGFTGDFPDYGWEFMLLGTFHVMMDERIVPELQDKPGGRMRELCIVSSGGNRIM